MTTIEEPLVLSGSGEEGPVQVDAVVWFLCVSLILGAMAEGMVKLLPHSWWRPPFTVLMFTAGAMMSAMKNELSELGTEMVNAVEDAHPHVILYVLLPPLIYDSASSLDWHVFKRTSPQALLLAFPGVVVAAFVTGGLVKACFTDYNWSFTLSLLLGSIVSATDPVAVVAALHQLGAPKHLSSVIEGESLLNDGSAFVLFLILVKDITGEGLSAAGTVEFFFRLALGGPAFGLAMGVLLGGFLAVLNFTPVAEITITVASIFSTFFISERELEVSGVLATVVLGLFMSARGRFVYSPGTLPRMREFLAVIASWSNAAIFVLAGVIAYDSAARNDDVASDGTTWGYAVLLYVLLHLVRALVVLVLWPLLTRTGYGLTWKEAAIVVFGGLRGAVALALMLILRLAKESVGTGADDNFLDMRRFEVLISAVVVLTLVINGTTVGAVYRWLEPYKPNQYHSLTFARAMRDLEDACKGDVREALSKDWLFSGADWPCVDSMVPDLTRVTFVNGNVVVPDGLLHSRVVDTFVEFFRHAADGVVAGATMEVAEVKEEQAAAVAASSAFAEIEQDDADDEEEDGAAGGGRRRRAASVDASAGGGRAAPPRGPLRRANSVVARVNAIHRSEGVRMSGLRLVTASHMDDAPRNGDGEEDAAGTASPPQDGVAAAAEDDDDGPAERESVLLRDLSQTAGLDDREHEVAGTLANMLEANFMAQFESGQCGEEAVVLLVEATGNALDRFRGPQTKSTAGDEGQPAVRRLSNALWRALGHALEHRPLPCVPTAHRQHGIQRLREYASVFLRTEALSSYARAVVHVSELAEHAFPRAGVRASLCCHLPRARAEVDRLSAEAPHWAVIVRTVLTARAYTLIKRKRLEEMAEEGLIPHGNLEELLGVLDHTTLALEFARLNPRMSRFAAS